MTPYLPVTAPGHLRTACNGSVHVLTSINRVMSPKTLALTLSNAANCGLLENALRGPSFINRLCCFCFDASGATCSRLQRRRASPGDHPSSDSAAGLHCVVLKGPSFTRPGESAISDSVAGSQCSASGGPASPTHFVIPGESVAMPHIRSSPLSDSEPTKPSFTDRLCGFCSGVGPAACSAQECRASLRDTSKDDSDDEVQGERTGTNGVDGVTGRRTRQRPLRVRSRVVDDLLAAFTVQGSEEW